MLLIKINSVGSDTVLSNIVQLVEDAQSSKAPIQAFADRVSQFFVPVVVALSAITFTGWFIVAEAGLIPESWTSDHHKGDPADNAFLFAFEFGIAVRVPCILHAPWCALNLRCMCLECAMSTTVNAHNSAS